MGIHIVCETRGYEEVSPVLICQFDCFLKLQNIAMAQLERRETNSLQLELVTLFTKREVVAASMQQKFKGLAS